MTLNALIIQIIVVKSAVFQL